MTTNTRTASFVKSHSQSGQGPVIVQVLPALVRGGVERGTIEMARAIIEAGGKAVVISAGGPLVRHLDRIGAVAGFSAELRQLVAQRLDTAGLTHPVI